MLESPLLNPFTKLLSTGTLLSAGREVRLAEIAAVISQEVHENRDLHGLPNVGKSTLLRQLAGSQYLSPLHDQFLDPYRKKPHRLFIVYVSGWLESIHPCVLIYREYYRRFKGYLDWVCSIDEEYKTQGLPSISEPGEIDPQNAALALNHLEVHLWALRDVGVRVVMLLDDFDSQWAFGRLSIDEAARINSWRDYFSLICTTERLLEDVNREARKKMSPLFKRLTQRHIANLSNEGARQFVQEALGEAENLIPEEDIEKLIDWSGGFPYLLLLGGEELWEFRSRTNLLSEPVQSLTEPIRTYLRVRLGQKFETEFRDYYEWLQPERQAVLIEIAQKGAIPVQPLPDVEYISHMSWLENYGLVQLRQGHVELFSPLFRDFLLARLSIAPTGEPSPEPDLPPRQADLYETFRSRPGEALSYVELGQAVWSLRADKIDEVEKRKIHLAIHKLRAELKRAGRGDRIVNVRKRGYRYEPAS